jgi:hypothetical protein
VGAWVDPDADRLSANPALCREQARDYRSAAGRDSLSARAEPLPQFQAGRMHPAGPVRQVRRRQGALQQVVS